jgi:murein DD-endopeptidase MepM/ murein hydrolase activator NlpD
MGMKRRRTKAIANRQNSVKLRLKLGRKYATTRNNNDFNVNTALKEPKFRLRWLAAVGIAPLFGVAAFGIAPNTETDDVEVRKVIEQLSLPEASPEIVAEAEFWREEPIRRGDTVASVLGRLDVEDKRALDFLRQSKEARPLYRLRTGKTLQVKTSQSGELIALRHVLDSGELLSIEKKGGGYQVIEGAGASEPHLTLASGVIESSLFAATDAANIPDVVAIQLAEIFSSDVDFHQDLRKGDRFAVAYEAFYLEGEPIRTGRVLAAEFVNSEDVYQAVYFEDPQGRGGYYSPEGKNLRKAFLRSPLEFSRITSGFSRARFHPVLQSWRAHKGIDYAAPTGTRVRATADGVVKLAGRQNGYGNVVILEHQGKYSTLYGHLSRFAVRTGERVQQGEVIGYVGMTGLATGPHLHYEFRADGRQQNPLRVATPAAPPITSELKPAFDHNAASLAKRLEQLRGFDLAAAD